MPWTRCNFLVFSASLLIVAVTAVSVFPRGEANERVPGTTVEILTPTQGVDFSSFLQGLSESVKKSWYAKMPDEAKTQKQKGKVVIRFVVLKDGSLAKGSPLLVTGSGVRNLDDAAILAVKDSAPFKDFPPEFPGSNIELEFRFLYNLPAELDTKDMPENKGSISLENTYSNPALRLTLVLPGAWHFFDRTMYTTAQQKQEEEEAEKKALANCQGPLCGHGEIDVALQSPMTQPPKMSVYLTAYKLSAEYQNRERHPLRKFAEIMSVGSMGPHWVSEGELTAIQLGGKPAYRLIVHHRENPTAKGFLYVADSNVRVFMLLAVAMSDPEQLQMAVEHLKLTSPEN